MSYIHEALKKAQKDKDARRGEYDGVLSTGRKGAMPGAKRVIRAVLLGVILLFLAFGAYSWLNSKVPETPKAIEPRKEQPRPVAPKPPVIDPGEIYGRARALHVAGRLTDARRLYLETLEIDPGHTEALNNLGVIAIHEKDYASAHAFFEKATRLRPGYVDPYYNLACLCAIKGEPDQGLVYLKKAVSLYAPVRDWARKDPDLKGLRGLPEFQKIIQE